MPNINAALGVAQLEQLDGFVGAKRTLHQRYQQVFAHISGLRVFIEQPWSEGNHWLNSLCSTSLMRPCVTRFSQRPRSRRLRNPASLAPTAQIAALRRVAARQSGGGRES